jgi:hypothetical protein
VAKSQPGTRIAAASLVDEHAVVATLESRTTTEGSLLQAFVTLDDQTSTRLSDDGAGATAVHLVSREDRVLAVYLDARTSMVPVHARNMRLRDATLVLDEDVVVHVAGPPERGLEFAPATAGKSMFALVPMGRDVLEFGLASIPIFDAPKTDVTPLWSLYPNGLDPAPVAATLTNDDPAWVARVRPVDAMPGAKRVLELGRLDSGGRFVSLGFVSERRITDVSIARDVWNSVWLLYGDATATWLERRVCP